ncbi:flagellar basal body rod protein FlgG [Clostridium botulinum C]|uniref:Flagellar basal body rod protein FlgG n=2 Tax=Clostridium botulinum TaxID=1491 RepID=A0A9Q4TBL7_CLOBO|nr:flagellar hook-basal body complex protein [Clostridium botulinum]EGO87507.1 flagellar basal body rod protein FlgG [Clostridium botulinum C str. Stockholm]MCD3194126.1 flagellar basal body rod protein FlgG [Clostridium botulinum C]MCD3199245.1 flagellar basal body rod protein FlgG [Clostridium botulinum C]MCD3204720.1 flagellar basal body rod protein FlgG [Clostridium botulinum C]MCD3208063.1 flagellar basal body rod protein FlgG [Clostridium botulinum C]
MLRSIWNSRSGMSAEMDKLDAISNNMANSTTVGYKRVDVKFNDLMQENLDRLGYPVSKGQGKLQVTGGGVKSTEIERDNAQGNLLQTNNNTDLAIDGKGYFKVVDGEGRTLYTRGGSFNIDPSGTVVDKNGNRLVILNENGIDVNTGRAGFTKESFNVSEDGYLRSDKHRGLRIPIYDTIGDNSMKSIGENLYTPLIQGNGRNDVIESKDFSLLQGFTEQSNVDLGKEMTDLIVTQRAFQLNSSALKTADEMWGMANNLRGR